jgi:hypothetical protein
MRSPFCDEAAILTHELRAFELFCDRQQFLRSRPGRVVLVPLFEADWALHRHRKPLLGGEKDRGES